MTTDEQIAKWAKRLERVIRQAPKGCWLFVGDDAHLHVMRTDVNGNRIENQNGVDQSQIVHTINAEIEIDGGEW